MEITSSILFDLLNNQYPVVELSGGIYNLPVSTPKLLSFQETEANVLYICEWDEALLPILHEGCSYLIISNEAVPEQSFPKCSAAVIKTSLSALSLLYKVFELMQTLQDWDLALKESRLSPQGLPKVFEAGKILFPYPFVIVDRNFYIVASTPDYNLGFDAVPQKEGIKIPSNQVDGLLLNPEFVQVETITDVFHYPLNLEESYLICMNILHDGQYLARVLAKVSHGGTPGIRYHFKHMCQYLKASYLTYSDDVLIKHQNDKIHSLFRRLIEGEELSDNMIDSVIEQYGWSRDHEYSINCIERVDIKDFDIVSLYLCNHLEKNWSHSCAVKGNNEIIWIVNHSLMESGSSQAKFSLAFVYLIRDFCCKAGISNRFQIKSPLSLYYQQARKALEIGRCKNPHLWYYYFSDYTLDFMFDLMPEAMSSEQLCHPSIIKLLEADQTNDESLVRALYFYITCHFNSSTAAEQTFVHRSTFIRQLDKIKEITGIDWRHPVEPNTLLHVLASFKLLHISYERSL